MKKSDFRGILILTFLSVFLLATHLFAQNSDCPDLGSLNSKWPQYYLDIHLDAPLEQPLLCQSLQYKIAKALDIISKTHIPGVDNLYQQVVSQYPKTVIDLETDYPFDAFSVFKTVPAKKYSKGYDREVILYSKFFEIGNQDKDYLPIMDYIRAETLVHEYKHMASGIGHVICNNSDDTVRPDCDREFSENWETASPYSASILFLGAVLKDKYLTPIQRKTIQRAIYTISELNFLQIDKESVKKYYQ